MRITNGIEVTELRQLISTRELKVSELPEGLRKFRYTELATMPAYLAFGIYQHMIGPCQNGVDRLMWVAEQADQDKECFYKISELAELPAWKVWKAFRVYPEFADVIRTRLWAAYTKYVIETSRPN